MEPPLLAARKLAPLFVAIAVACAAGCRDRGTKTISPSPATRPAALAPEVAEDLDRVVEDAIKRGEVPGAVLVVGHSGGIVYQKAYGNRAVAPAPEPMTLDTVFDLASLTKPLATATSVLILAERGKIDLKAPVAKLSLRVCRGRQGGRHR